MPPSKIPSASQNPLPVQVPSTSPHEIRNEIHSVRKELDEKIEKKLPENVFYWGIGTLITVLIVVLGGIIGYFSTQISCIKDEKINKLEERLTILETQYKVLPNASSKH